MSARVAIVGGGISGLTAARALAEQGNHVDLFEASPRLGGNLHTVRREGYLIDEGPDSWVAGKPHATELARALGLGDELIETRESARRVYVVAPTNRRWLSRKLSGLRPDDPLVPLPEGLMLGAPTQLVPLATTPLLGWAGKLRAAMDLVIPQSGRGGDESIGALVERRLGKEVLDAIAGPLLGGLFSGDVASLSVLATFPQLRAFERAGGMILGGRAAMPKRVKGGPPRSAFRSLLRGMGSLVDALAAKVGERAHLGALVRSIGGSGRKDDPWTLDLAGTPVRYDHVIIAGPAHLAAKLIGPIDEGAARVLDEIPYGSASTVFLAYHHGEIPRRLDATGYLVPRSMRSSTRTAIASTWVSSKWAGRAPTGQALLRVFFGPDSIDRADASLVEDARDELRRTLGVTAEPHLTHVARFVRASPQPRVGHLDAMRSLRARLAERAPNLHLLGSAYDGVGIPDCVRQAQWLAQQLARPIGAAEHSPAHRSTS